MSFHPRVQDHTQSTFDHVIADESELTAGCKIEPGKSYGFFTDTTVCIGCKACEVACKEWNNLPADNLGLTGQSFDNTGALSANTWRHVAFVERSGCGGVRDMGEVPFQSAWLMMSDVCKHCHNAPCLEACPTGALFRTEFDTVVVQQDICNGCGYCVPACPFGVIDVSTNDGKAHKCTLCYDRLKGGLEPACSKSCPTDSIQFGELGDLQQRAAERVDTLHGLGVTSAYLYGTPDAPGSTGGLGHLGAFFLLTERPEVYNLPVAPTRPADRVAPSLMTGLLTMAGLALAATAVLSRRT
ncbi:4Fe-4S dicluster domain-containing protein [Lichenihabitans sp. Uapishka_5]|uniref:4Fe-4S dicluster domain-containing protein n=1 Tax=Lichenihabitans sp. Uapishka_5 TaxID=3037302 RepID=UPI0029E7E70B|nr:4Fe-4S dicluster domain-containing protein [Lichenihabitans sp. Uapishka_5]MDX7950216.1 4Fe-4S dicluster domain-containing protein [Lichenihabitans sp. Uapishka_5]